MNGPGMHSSGPRPKSHSGSPAALSSPTSTGAAQLKWAVPADELPLGEQCTPSVWLVVDGVLPLLNTTSRSPFGKATEYEPWSKLQSFAFAGLPVNTSPNWQRPGAAPRISSGVDQVRPWSVDIVPKIGDSQNAGAVSVPPRQFVPNLNTVHVR